MKNFPIPTSKVWAGSVVSRHWNRLSGLYLPSKLNGWQLKIDFGECEPGTTIKVCGLAYLTCSFNRVRRGGFHELLSFTHEDSDRIIATRTKTGIKLRVYSYRSGVGPATPSQTPNLKAYNGSELCEIENGEVFDLVIGNGEWRLEGSKTVTKPTPKTPLHNLVSKSFAHAKGYKQPHAPSLIKIKAKSWNP